MGISHTTGGKTLVPTGTATCKRNQAQQVAVSGGSLAGDSEDRETQVSGTTVKAIGTGG